MKTTSRQTLLNKKFFTVPSTGNVTKTKRSKELAVVKKTPQTLETKTRLFSNTSCVVEYHPSMLTRNEASRWFSVLKEKVEWHEEEVVIFGKSLTVARKMAYFGNFSYYYSGSTKRGQGWPEWLVPLKERIEDFLGVAFNYALMNFYKDGSDYIGYHSDDEKDLVEGSIIASVSLGAERDFLFQRRYSKNFSGKKEPVTKILLNHGSLLTMGGTTQKEYKHSLPKRAKCRSPRINITFRNVQENQ